MRSIRESLADALVRLYLGTAAILVLLLVAGFWWWSTTGEPRLVLPWYLATVEGLSLLAGISIAFLCLGRYQVVREPASLWVGVAFLANGVLTLLYILSWPGLVR